MYFRVCIEEQSDVVLADGVKLAVDVFYFVGGEILEFVSKRIDVSEHFFKPCQRVGLLKTFVGVPIAEMVTERKTKVFLTFHDHRAKVFVTGAYNDVRMVH